MDLREGVEPRRRCPRCGENKVILTEQASLLGDTPLKITAACYGCDYVAEGCE